MAAEFIPHTPEEIAEMLEAIGVSSIEELFADIPAEVLKRYKPLGLGPKSELEVAHELRERAAQNLDPTEFVSFLGGGIYDHFIPAVVEHLISRSEFYTAYTPYQAEVSQGTLTWMFEFQTMVCELTGMEVANSSMYDGATALAEAMFMAARVTGKRKFLLAASLNPHYRQVLRTYAWAAELELIELPYDERGLLARRALDQALASGTEFGGLLIQSPNFFGVIEDLEGLKESLGQAFLIVSTNPISLGLLRPPGEFGADIVVGEGQALGNPPDFGGPLLGLFATRQKYLRQMPGRVSGRTVDAEGKTGYVMALQTREQHIRRERATSNICTNEALCALAATVWLSALGKEGLRELAELNLQKAHYLAERISGIKGYRLKFAGPFFNEFVVQTPRKPGEVLAALREAEILGGLDLSPYGLGDSILVAVTEKRTREELDLFVEGLREA
ncbi:MAG: aminomethyl-transferring glycine dehydrogenase subunit GcvPA [Candidatus Acetothermia bacterium]|nr:aminomethyl-transferring glycine dehydrogenase subunit GcvPA [Candidatus Acetothermia bacterium]MDH7505120.1 aminomethyl-transferring glycine dehydrogenase subunit GcvPA [Candidatus Acetothermia bacterium]